MFRFYTVEDLFTRGNTTSGMIAILPIPFLKHGGRFTVCARYFGIALDVFE